MGGRRGTSVAADLSLGRFGYHLQLTHRFDVLFGVHQPSSRFRNSRICASARMPTHSAIARSSYSSRWKRAARPCRCQTPTAEGHVPVPLAAQM